MAELMAEREESCFWVMTVEEEPEDDPAVAPDPGDAFSGLMGRDPEVTRDFQGSKGVKTIAGKLTQRVTRRVKAVAVPVKTVEASMKQMLTQLGGMLERVQGEVKELGGMELDEIEVQLEISGSGEVGFMGTGVEAGSRGAIVLKFKRQLRQPTSGQT